MTTAATETILDCLEERLAWAGASTAEAKAVLRIAAKCSDAKLTEAIRKHAKLDSLEGAERTEAVLYSFTEIQVLEFFWTLKTVDGWD